jgi:regulator of sirC expression with transglutaminase-like and TPR domain
MSDVVELEIAELEALRQELESRIANAEAPRWNADPEDVQRSVGKLVLTLVDFIRQLLERQAIRRMDANTLTPEEVEGIGLALMRLEETVHEMARRFGLDPEELNLDLGPLGRLI